MIVYRRRKTRKLYSIKITAEAERIIGLYKVSGSKYLISLFKFGSVGEDKVREEAELRIRPVILN